MADPKRKVYDFVMTAMTSPSPDVLPILPNLLNFLVVLSMVDPTFLKPLELEKAAVIVCSKLTDNKIEYGVFLSTLARLIFNFKVSRVWALFYYTIFH